MPSVPQLFRQTLLGLNRAVRLVWSSAPSWTAASALLLFLEGLLPLAALYLMKLIVDSLSQPDFSRTLTLVALAGLVALLTALSRTTSSIVSETQAAMVSDSIQDILHAKSIALDQGALRERQLLQLTSPGPGRSPYRPVRIVSKLAQLGQSSISLAGVALLLLAFNWLLAAVLLLAALPVVFARLRYSVKLFGWQMTIIDPEKARPHSST